MKQHLLSGLLILSVGVLCISSCSDEDERPSFPLSAEVFHSAVGKQVAFTALTHSASSWTWDFGDGQTSTEKDPVHVYEEGGYYIATLTASDGKGNSVTKEVKLALELTPYAMLTGDHTADDYAGKKWKLSADHSSGGDYFAYADATFTVVDDTPKPLPTGIFDLEFGMGDIYKDEFTFFYDGSYQHDVKEDGASFGGYVYELVTNSGDGIVNDNGAAYGLCIAQYTPEAGATFTFTEDEDFAVPSMFGANGTVTYNDVMTLDFSGTEFIGFRDFQRKVIVTSITNTRMQLVMFMAASPGDLPKNSHALILSFDAVN